MLGLIRYDEFSKEEKEYPIMRVIRK